MAVIYETMEDKLFQERDDDQSRAHSVLAFGGRLSAHIVELEAREPLYPPGDMLGTLTPEETMPPAQRPDVFELRY